MILAEKYIQIQTTHETTQRLEKIAMIKQLTDKQESVMDNLQ